MRLDTVSVSSVLLTICLSIFIQWNLKWAATWRTRNVWVIDRSRGLITSRPLLLLLWH